MYLSHHSSPFRLAHLNLCLGKMILEPKDTWIIFTRSALISCSNLFTTSRNGEMSMVRSITPTNLVALLTLPIKERILPLTREETNRYVHLCDLFYNFTAQHHFRSHFYLMSNNILVRVASLLKAKDKHLRHGKILFNAYYGMGMTFNFQLPSVFSGCS